MSALKNQVGGDHYKKMVIQPIEFCEKNGLSACETKVVKYITRHRAKHGFEDVMKARHMAELLAELVYPEEYARWQSLQEQGCGDNCTCAPGSIADRRRQFEESGK